MRYFRLIMMAMFVSVLGMACDDFLEEKSQDEVIPTSVTDFREILLHYQATPFSPVIYILDDDVVMDEYFFSQDEDDYEVLEDEPTLQEEETKEIDEVTTDYLK